MEVVVVHNINTTAHPYHDHVCMCVLVCVCVCVCIVCCVCVYVCLCVWVHPTAMQSIDVFVYFRIHGVWTIPNDTLL